MKLDDLNEMERQAKQGDARAAAARRLQAQIAEIRKGDVPLMVAYKNMGYSHDAMKSAIEGVINEHGADLLRILEMRQLAFARACDTRTRLNRQAVASALGDGNGDSNA